MISNDNDQVRMQSDYTYEKKELTAVRWRHLFPVHHAGLRVLVGLLDLVVLLVLELLVLHDYRLHLADHLDRQVLLHRAVLVVQVVLRVLQDPAHL